MNCFRMLGTLLALLAGLSLGVGPLGASTAGGASPPLPWICSDGDRFGVWDPKNAILRHDVAQLHAGWYTGWTVRENPPRPAGMMPVQLVRLSSDGPYGDRACAACPSWEKVRRIAQKNPGSLWFIGNEPDRQDYVTAGRYAELYHDFYTFLKQVDPSSQAAIGGVVQPTPIRLQYLDMILDAYQTRFGQRMPVDVWNVHNYVLREGATGWGGGVPPETDERLAIEYGLQDHDNVAYWASHLVAMRRWMHDRGYRDRPLVITEYGILMPEIYGYDTDRVRDFMLATFDWLTSTTDTQTGYPADGNRLVQAWLWYSLDEEAFEGFVSWSHLFDPSTRVTTALGQAYGGYTAPLTAPLPGSVDLQPVAVRLSGAEPGASGHFTATVTAIVNNGGASPASSVPVRFERDGAPAGTATIELVPAGGLGQASIVWPDLVPGIYQVDVQVDPDAQIVECDRFNNSLSLPLLVAELQLIYLPILQRN